MYLTFELAKRAPGIFGVGYVLSHKCWYFDDDHQDKYILSIFRDPVKRSISHFAFDCLLRKLTNHPKQIEPNIKNFWQWMEEWGEYLSNFQAKNILYSSPNEPFINFSDKTTDFENIIIDDKKLLNRLEHIEILLNTDQLNIDTIEKVANKIKLDLQFKNTNSIIRLDDSSTTFTGNKENINQDSAKLYSQLLQVDLDYLKKLNNIDYEIYNNKSLFWNGDK